MHACVIRDQLTLLLSDRQPYVMRTIDEKTLLHIFHLQFPQTVTNENTHCVIHPSIFKVAYPSCRVGGSWGQSQLTWGEKRVTRWIGHQPIAGPTEKQTPSRPHTYGQFRITNYADPLWSDSTQKGLCDACQVKCS